MLRIRLRRHDGGHRAQIHSNRPLASARLFEGRSAQTALALIPALFSVCGRAHGVAAVRALESATGLQAPRATEGLRELVVLAENLREHLLRIHMDWPTACGTSLPPGRLAQVNRITQALLATLPARAALALATPGTPPPVLLARAAAEALAGVRGFIERAVLGLPCRSFSSLHDGTSFDRWRQDRDTVATRFLNHVHELDFPGGPRPPAPLPELPAGPLAEALGGPQGAQLVARPRWHGRCHETGPYSRCLGAPLLAALSARGALMPRHSARLLELARTLEAMEALCQDPAAGGGGACHGLAWVEAARGRLVHWVRLDGAQITRYRILAPTEWNFHPQGIAAQLLSRIPPGPTHEVLHRARLVVAAVDPCIGYDLHMADPQHSEPAHAWDVPVRGYTADPGGAGPGPALPPGQGRVAGDRRTGRRRDRGPALQLRGGLPRQPRRGRTAGDHRDPGAGLVHGLRQDRDRQRALRGLSRVRRLSASRQWRR